MKAFDLVVGKRYRFKKNNLNTTIYELTAVGYFNVLLMDHEEDNESTMDRDTFIGNLEEVPELTIVTLYRHTIKYSDCVTISQSEWTNVPAEDYRRIYVKNAEIIKTETKEVEI